MLTSLRLQDFRCFTSLAFEVPPAGVILVGNNAQGKTSILEALCVLIRLHSPRCHRMSPMDRIGKSAFGIAGDPWQMERRVEHSSVGLILKVDQELRQTHAEYVSDGGLLVWMGNEDLDLIRGPGEGRRKFLDFLGSQINPGYRTAWSRYRRALRAKNLLLKNPQTTDTEINSYDEILITEGTYLTESRKVMVGEMAPLAARAQRFISGQDELLTLTYRPGGGTNFRAALAEARTREVRMRQALVGPHRDELILRIDGNLATDYASEGQQRTIALALKLAQGEMLHLHSGKPPLYLLDDIFGELDPERRNALMNFLPPLAQKWITTTHLDWLNDSPLLTDASRLSIARGQVLKWRE